MKIEKYQFYLFDIEGTVAPISFVHKVLFPYSQKNLSSHLEKNPVSIDLYKRLEKEYSEDKKLQSYSKEFNPSPASLLEYLNFLIEVDRKSPVLKEIQGEIWKFGYESGEIQSIIFSDTLDFFRAIQNQKKEISIYSSGSILAQKLIFQYSILGDLTPFISNYFDTGVGAKRDEKSYQVILESLKANPKEVVFFTDIYEEALAASKSGISSYLLNREGNAPISQSEFKVIQDFKEWK